MPVCKNIKSKTYTGKENTPLGRGYSASVEKLGTKKKGKDGKYYVVINWGKEKRWSLVGIGKKNLIRSVRGATMSGMRGPEYKFREEAKSMGLTDEQAEIAVSLKFVHGLDDNDALDLPRELDPSQIEAMLRLKKAGINKSTSYLIADFGYDIENMIKLKKAGVSDEILLKVARSALTEKQIESLIRLEQAGIWHEVSYPAASEFNEEQIETMLKLKQAGIWDEVSYPAVRELNEKQIKTMLKLAENTNLHSHTIYDISKKLDLDDEQIDGFIKLFNAGYKYEDITKYIRKMTPKQVDFAIDWKKLNYFPMKKEHKDIPDDVKLLNSSVYPEELEDE